MVTETDLFNKVEKAIISFLKDDHDLLLVNSSERSMTHKLAEHLQNHFTEHKVDCEYNRYGNDIKRLFYSCNYKKIKPDDHDAKTVFPDIVVHSRGNNESNLLVIEVKKERGGRNNLENDIEKLKAFTGPEYKYEHGLLLVFDVNKKCIDDVMYFSGGREKEENTIWSDLKSLGYKKGNKNEQY